MMTEKSLHVLRESITQLDQDIIELLAKRRSLAKDVALFKLNHHQPVRDREREQNLLRQLIEKGNALGLDSAYINRLYYLIIEDSVLLQQELLDNMTDKTTEDSMCIAFLGPKGSYSHLASRHYASRQQKSFIECACSGFDSVFQQVECGEADVGILPIENASSGSINEVYDLLQSTSLSIIGELFIPIDHALLGVDGVRLEEVKTLYTHPQPYQQCSRYLAGFHHWQIVYCDSSSSAMSKVAELKTNDAVALGSESGGELYGLRPLSHDLANQKRNSTRFIVVAKKAMSVSLCSPAKTTILLATGQQAGALVEALLVLRNYNIVMTKLESRPIWGNPWEEMFYIDMLGHLQSDSMQQALADLRGLTRSLKVLGCYLSDHHVQHLVEE